MILDFGYVCMEFHTKISDFSEDYSHTEEIFMCAGGSGLHRAIAAARIGAKISLLGAFGEDLFAQEISKILHRDGINTTGFIKVKDKTGLTQIIQDQSGKRKTINCAGANNHAKAEQISDHYLGPKTLIVCGGDMPQQETENLMMRATKKGSLIIFCKNTHQKPTTFCDHIIEFKEQSLISNGNRINLDNIWGNQLLLFDIFCGVFAACTQARLDPAQSIKLGKLAVSVAKERVGSLNPYPYLHEIEALDKNKN